MHKTIQMCFIVLLAKNVNCLF